MILAERFRKVRVLSVGVAISVVAATALIAAAPAQADETYPRPWDSSVTMSGHGYGHGHGMSQWGAYGAAKVGGLSWQSILAFYYPGTTLTKLANITIRVRLDVVGSGNLQVPNAVGLRVASGTRRSGELPQFSGGVPVTRYRVRPLATTGRVEVEMLAGGVWKHFSELVAPAVFTNPSRGNIVDVLLTSGTSRAYRGAMSANRLSATSLRTVNTLPMESYLRAVVPAEMPASWHANAVRSQAVAARSYANQNRANAPAGQDYDTCDTTSCQMYSGIPAEAAASDAAIVATAGQTLTYLGKAAFTQFSAANGGYSAAGSQPYLVAKPDPYDGAIPNSAHSWTKSVTVASIEKAWPAIGSYRRLRIISRDGNGQWGGRVLTAAVEGSAGSVTVTGAAIRTALGLRSEWFIPTYLSSAPSYPRDFSGDHKADVLAVVGSTRDLRMYVGNGASGWSSMSVVGTGFRGFSKVFTAGTWDTDALSDVLAQKPDGSLWLYPGTPADPLGPPRQVGAGWGIYNHIFPVGDFGGDRRSDLLARRPDGALVLYSGNGTGGFLKNTRQVGSGWGSFTALFSPGDFDGDGRADVVARSPGGELYLYPGNGSGGWLPRRVIGHGWESFTIMSSGDFSGDRKSDLFARGADGRMWLYPGDGTGGFLPRKAVGSGWNIFSTLLL